MLHPPLLVECCNRFLMAPRSDVHPASSAGFCIVAQGRTVLSGHPEALLPGSTRVFWLLLSLGGLLGFGNPRTIRRKGWSSRAALWVPIFHDGRTPTYLVFILASQTSTSGDYPC